MDKETIALVIAQNGLKTASLLLTAKVARLEKQLAKNGLGLEVTESARNRIAALGYDPAMGARPVKRIIQQEIQNPLATELLRGDYPEGTTIVVDSDGDGFTFDKKTPEPTKREPAAAGRR